MTGSKLILTANQRLASYLKSHPELLSKERAEFNSIQVEPWRAWLNKLYELYQHTHPAASRRLLQAFEANKLWRRLIQQVYPDHEFLNGQGLAELAQSAWDLLSAWNLDYKNLGLQLSPDVQFFQKLCQEYEAVCHKGAYFDHAMLDAFLVDHISQLDITWPTHIELRGFDDISPKMAQILKRLADLNIEILQSESVQVSKIQSCTVAFMKLEDEIQAMIQYAKQVYLTQPEARIGCIVPELHTHRAQIIRVLEAQFEDIPNAFEHINISGGEALISYPLIQTAFNLLEFNNGKLSLSAWTAMILNPYISGAQSEQSQRVMLDIKLRRKRQNEMSVTMVKSIAQTLAPDFHQILNQALHHATQRHKKSNLHEHVNSMVAILQAFGWPGDQPLSSQEYQLLMRFKELLEQVLSLADLCLDISYAEALSELKRLAQQHAFQMQSPPDTRFEILGVLESAGLPFDVVWVMGLNEHNWPAPAKPNPFIPYALQRQEHMPHASNEREWLYAERIQQRLINSGSQVIFSYAQHEGDEPCEISPLLASLEVQAANDLLAFNKVPEYNLSRTLSIESECVLDEQAPALLENEKISGGSGILKDQSDCPFRALAHFRLKARALDQPEPGLTPQERGHILHKSLEKFWNKVKSRAQLARLTEAEKKHYLTDILAEAISDVMFRIGKNLTSRFLELEQQRMIEIILKWLELELERDDFQVLATEQTIEGNIGKLAIRLQVDRIDRMDSGEILLIDYKSSDLSPQTWFGERLEQPQLPIYAILHSEPVAAMAFARIHFEKMGFKGLCADSSGTKGIIKFNPETYDEAAQTWQEQLALWKLHLKKLAEDFCEGKAQLDPREGYITCQDCDLQVLCRVNSMSV